MAKKLLVVFLLFAILGCSKNEEKKPEEDAAKSFTVNIKVDANAQTFNAIQSISTGKNTLSLGDPLLSFVKYIYYRIYKSDGKLFTSVKQTPVTTNFGSIVQELPVGDYKIFIAASEFEILFIDNGNFAYDYYGFPSGWVDVFTSSTLVSVTTADVSQEIKLERPLGMLSLKITDAIPSGTERIVISRTPESSYKYINGTPAPNNIGMAYNGLVSGQAGAVNMNFSMFTGNTGVAIKINVKAYNYSNVLIAEKNIPDVTFAKNKKTQINLQLFTP